MLYISLFFLLLSIIFFKLRDFYHYDKDLTCIFTIAMCLSMVFFPIFLILSFAPPRNKNCPTQQIQVKDNFNKTKY